MSNHLTFNEVKSAMDVLAKIPPDQRADLISSVDKYCEGALTGEELNDVITKAC